MVGVGQVRVVVDERRMPVRVRVRLHHALGVFVTVVLVVDVDVLVFQGEVLVKVPVTRAQHEAHPEGHHESGPDIPDSHVFMQ